MYDLEGNPSKWNKVKEQILEGDLIVTVGLLGTVMVRDGIRDIPSKKMIFSMLFDPGRFSLPDKTATGVSLDLLPETAFSKIKQIFPNVKKVGILYDPQKNKNIIEANKTAAKSAGLSLIVTPVLSEKDVPRAVSDLFDQIDLLWLIPDSTVLTPQSIAFILLSSLEHRLPIVTFSEDLVKMGATASISPDYKAVGETLGKLTQRVLKGEDVRKIPLEYVKKNRLTINKKTAQKIGIEIPKEVLKNSDRVYE
jgi:putative ABC transport system substrate-binding protein